MWFLSHSFEWLMMEIANTLWRSFSPLPFKGGISSIKIQPTNFVIYFVGRCSIVVNSHLLSIIINVRIMCNMGRAAANFPIFLSYRTAYCCRLTAVRCLRWLLRSETDSFCHNKITCRCQHYDDRRYSCGMKSSLFAA